MRSLSGAPPRIGSRPPGTPVSLYQPQKEAAADRAVFSVETAAAPNSAPDADENGHNTLGLKKCHISVEVIESGATVTYQVYTRSYYDGLWHLRDDVGVGGTVTVTEGVVPHPPETKFDFNGADRVYVHVTSNGATTDGFNLWIAGSGKYEDG